MKQSKLHSAIWGFNAIAVGFMASVFFYGALLLPQAMFNSVEASSVDLNATCIVDISNSTTNEPITWTVIPTGGDSPYSISWSGDYISGSALSVVTSYPYPGTYTAIATVTSGNSSASCSASVTVNAPPPPLTATCSVNPDSALTGENVTWSAVPFGGTGQYTYSWGGDDGLSGSSRTVNKSYSSAGVYGGSVTVTSGNETTAISCGSATIDTPPPVFQCSDGIDNDGDGKIDYPSDPGCTSPNDNDEQDPIDELFAACSVSATTALTGEAITWTVNALGGIGNYDFSWTGDNVSGNSPQVTTSYQTAGTYTATASVVSGNSSASCSASVTVNAPPPPLTATCSVNPDSALTGENVTWSAVPFGGTGQYTYSWGGDDGLSGSSRTVNKSYSSAGVYGGSVTVTSGNETTAISCGSATIDTPPPVFQCSDGIDNDGDGKIDYPSDPGCTSPNDNDEQDPIDELFAACSVSATTALTGEAITWTVNALGGIGNYDFSWTGDNVSGNSPQVTTSYQTAGTYTATASVVSGNSSASCSASVTVNAPPPPLTATCSVNPDSALTGENVTWSAVPFGGTGQYTYSWGGDDGLSGSSRTVNKSYSSAGVYGGSVTVTSGNETTAISCGSATIDTPPPVFQCSDGIDNDGDGKIDYPSDPGCTSPNDNDEQDPIDELFAACSVSATTALTGEAITWTVNALGGIGNYDFSWTGDNVSGNSPQVTTSYQTAGTYTATASVVSGNSSASCSASVTVNAPPPPLTATCSVNPDSALTGENVTWSAVPFGGTGQYTYSWGGDDGLSGSSRTVNKSYSSAGVYGGSVTVTSGNETTAISCGSATIDTPPPVFQCSDGIDNDGDGKIDYPSDPGCTSPNDNDEQDPIDELFAACSVSATTALTGEAITWTVNALGGIGNYDFSWTGDNVSGNSPQVTTSYQVAGTYIAISNSNLRKLICKLFCISYS